MILGASGHGCIIVCYYLITTSTPSIVACKWLMSGIDKANFFIFYIYIFLFFLDG